jgi:hypothetical protein
MSVMVVSVVQPPFDGDDEDQLFDAIIGQEVRIPRTVSANAKQVLNAVRAFAYEQHVY